MLDLVGVRQPELGLTRLLDHPRRRFAVQCGSIIRSRTAWPSCLEVRDSMQAAWPLERSSIRKGRSRMQIVWTNARGAIPSALHFDELRNKPDEPAKVGWLLLADRHAGMFAHAIASDSKKRPCAQMGFGAKDARGDPKPHMFNLGFGAKGAVSDPKPHMFNLMHRQTRSTA